MDDETMLVPEPLVEPLLVKPERWSERGERGLGLLCSSLLLSPRGANKKHFFILPRRGKHPRGFSTETKTKTRSKVIK